MKKRKLLSQRHPLLYILAVGARRIKRRVEWIFDDKKYASSVTEVKLPFRIKKHQSVLLKKLGENNEQLQINKVTNLKIAAAKINNIVIKPGETFSFCKLVGLPTKSKGYLLGMELSFGEAKAGIGGGIGGGLANDYSGVLVARLVEGLAAGVVQPIPVIIIMNAFAPEERGRASGLLGGAGG